MRVPEERFETYARGRPYHAALVDLRGDSSPHGHLDYYEMMAVVEGEGEQRLATGAQRLLPGDLLLVRPGDRHGLTGDGRCGVRFYNIAFPAAAWRAFVGLAAVERAAAWDESTLPPRTPGPSPTPPSNTPAAGPPVVRAACERALDRFHDGPTALDLVRFWTDVVPFLPGEAGTASGVPGWLAEVCATMRREEHLRAGVPRMLALAHVSAAHLARSVRRHYGVTPTAFVTELRLRHAATLLATTDESMTGIAERCGFGSASYFTRCFHQVHRVAPRDYRHQARRAFVP